MLLGRQIIFLGLLQIKLDNQIEKCKSQIVGQPQQGTVKFDLPKTSRCWRNQITLRIRRIIRYLKETQLP